MYLYTLYQERTIFMTNGGEWNCSEVRECTTTDPIPKKHLPALKREVYTQKTENRPTYWDLDFLGGNPSSCRKF